MSETIVNRTFDEERALYGRKGISVLNCSFDGPRDGESAFKECTDVNVKNSYFNLRYPFWHDKGLTLMGIRMTESCRAALWYSEDITVQDSHLHGIKALRECKNVVLADSDIVSQEFGWSTTDVTLDHCTATGEYFFLRGERLNFRGLTFKGKYSFQYVTDSVFEDCEFDTKDAFWHARNVTVRNSLIKGEYLSWYSENLTLENCTLIGTQPLCYCKGLRLVNCKMIDTDLAFERSEVEATVKGCVDSIKNPWSGTVRVGAVGEVIMDEPEARGRVEIDRSLG